VKDGKTPSLDEYLATGRRCLNFPCYTDLRDPGKIIVDRVIRYERLDEELGDVFQLLGIPYAGTLTVRAKSQFRKDRRDYREVLTKNQQEQVARLYAHEIWLHGYEF
jgi:hypothetical protein